MRVLFCRSAHPSRYMEGGVRKKPIITANVLTFEPGKFIFKGIDGPLAATPLRILKELHKAGRACTAAELIDAAQAEDDGSVIEKSTLRGYISEARQALREAMVKAGVNNIADPIKCVAQGKGADPAWLLILQ
jgi:hypothetical protein